MHAAPQSASTPSAAEPPAVVAEGLQFAYRGGQPIRFPDLRLEQGRHLLLRGPSGSGKSTWLAMVAGLCAPSQGQLVVAGRAMDGRVPDAWRATHVAVLPQRLHLSDAFDVRGNLALVDRAAGRAVRQEAIDQVLERLGLQGLVRRRPSQLSGGQAQRVALARALLARPRLILADEPTASLDDVAANAALAMLRENAEEQGASVIIATHDPRVALAWPEAEVMNLEGQLA